MKVIVVGGGAAGIMSAISASEENCQVTLIERNEKLGKKLFITGKGRCNVTNACDISEMMNKIVHNPRFLYSAFNSFDNNSIVAMLENYGCKLKVERGDRVFPVSDHSSDVISALKKMLTDNGVNVLYNTKVIDVILEQSSDKPQAIGVVLDNNTKLYADAIIFATGGASYPMTGSDGNGLDTFQKLGHNIVELRPALVPFNCSNEWIKLIQGLSLKNVEFKLVRNDKVVYNELGEMLFTHFGISGPIVLSASSMYEKGDKGIIDLKPGLSIEQLDARLIRDFKDNNNKNFANALDNLLPKSLIPIMIELSAIDPYKKVHQVTGEERKALVNLIKRLDVDIIGTRGFNEAIITRGGVNVKEINPKTCESKLVSNLYIAGEMIDVDAYTGGFNLQIAWSTGYLAGKSVVK